MGTASIPKELDICAPDRWTEDALLRREVREAVERLLTQGWTDALRALAPAARLYTFWDYMRDAWGRNAGLRLDHVLLSPGVAERLRGGGV